MDPKRSCPRCLAAGRSIPAETIQHLAHNPAALDAGRAWFCSTPACDVVYFDHQGATVATADVKVPVFQKETRPTRPVCYCFEHREIDIRAAQQPDGSNAIIDAITEACRKGLDRCEVTNPQGRCCLGNVRGVARGDGTSDDCGDKCGGLSGPSKPLVDSAP